MAPIIFRCFRALRELLVQFEVNNNYSTATDNHDFMLWLIMTCCIKLKCIASWHPKQAFVPLPGSAFAFLVVLHLLAALELRRAGSGLDLEACSC